ncbi:SYTL2 protein, partial [Falcunculus frontatus]|nr:SYTL2 protein [Falcunculus frontatus]
MIDLSFLTEEEQEAIMKVLQRDAELKRTEEERVRHLPEKIKDDVQLKNMSGQWFYEAKSKRHKDKIHGADIIRASMRRKPATIAEVGQNKTSKAKVSWVNNVNKEVFVPPDLHGIGEHQEEQQQKTGLSSKEVTPVLNKPEERPVKAVKQRRNPFNSISSSDNLDSGESENRPATVPQLSKKEILSLSEDSPPKSNLQNDETEKPKKPSVELTDESQKELVKRPVPKARKLIHKAADSISQREDLVPKPAKHTERVNGIGTPPRGILKRSSSSSSTDSEVRVSQMLDVQKKNGFSTATIFEGEGEKNSLMEEAEDSTQNSLEKLKQVRFSSSPGKGKPLQSPQLHHGKERGEHDLLKPDKKKNSGNYAVQSDSLGDKQISAEKPLGIYSSTSQMKIIDGLQEDTSASSPCDTNRSLFPVSESFQTQTVTPRKLETPQKTSSNILSNSSNERSVDEACENKSNQISSHESKSHKNFTGKRLIGWPVCVCSVHVFCLVTGSEEELNPVLMALKRSADRKKPSKSLEDIPSATSNKEKINKPKEELVLSAEDAGLKPDQHQERTQNAAGISTVPSQPDKLFSNPEKLKGLSKSVPSFLQEESDDRETDTASESSYSFGRIKKSPSSLTNLSSSSGMASLSSVSGSLMSIYSADFGNVDVKGNIQFAIDYVEQLNELHIFICQCKDLAVADVKRQRSDPYVKTYLLPEKYRLGKRKTSVKKKTFNPVYNEILRYKIEKDLLKNQSLNISVWHNDTFGRNSFLGEVELDLGAWDWNDPSNKQINWFPLKPRTSAITLNLENRGEMKLALQYVPHPIGGKKTLSTGEVHIWVKECHNLPLLRGNRLNSFIKCTILPDTSRKSRQKTRTVSKTANPVFNHTMVYDGFRPEDLKEACIELTVWDHNKLANHFLGGLRIGLGTGKSYGTTVDWMDSTSDETALWEKMMNSPNTWIEDTLPLRMLMVAKLTK